MDILTARKIAVNAGLVLLLDGCDEWWNHCNTGAVQVGLQQSITHSWGNYNTHPTGDSCGLNSSCVGWDGALLDHVNDQ